jgi:hypothetical protein
MHRRRASYGSARPLNSSVSRQGERAVGSVRIGYFAAFKGRDTLLIDGDVEGLGDLMRTLNVLVLAQQDVVMLHSLPFVSAMGPARGKRMLVPTRLWPVQDQQRVSLAAQFYGLGCCRRADSWR